MIETGVTKITASTISEIQYITDINGNIDVYIPISASSIGDGTNIVVSGDSSEEWCHNVSLLYAEYQPQGNIYFAHVTLDRYEYDSGGEILKDRTLEIIVNLFTNESELPILINHTIVQKGCEDKDVSCEYNSVTASSIQRIVLNQDCSFIENIISETSELKTYVLNEKCD